MNKEESLALFAKGRDAWNAWAGKMFDERAALKMAGAWVESRSVFDWNDEMRVWHAAAAVNFSQFTFQQFADFFSFVFPGSAEFAGATFAGDALFDAATFTGNARFAGATFVGNAEFHGTTFMSRARFREATFARGAEFGGATFEGGALFERATFTGDARFGGLTFTGDMLFGGAKFAGDALFDRATFTGDAGFSEVTFTGRALFSGAIFTEVAEFQQVVFEHYTSFDRARFERSANFGAIEAKSLFSLADATFLAVPDFIQAHFAEAPRLDNSRIALRRFSPFPRVRIKDAVKGGPYMAARWRALKRLAIQGHDHAREQVFFKGELKARRWSEDKPWHAVFWFGVFYQMLSDFGRSILRPIMWLGTSVFGFAGLYLALAKESSLVISVLQRLIGSSGAVPPLTCVAGPGEPLWSALLLSAQKGLVFLGQVPINKLNQIYACLYGIHTVDGTQPSLLPAPFLPVIPNGVTFLGFLQTPLSAALIFLFLLAIRNHFRIK